MAEADYREINVLLEKVKQLDLQELTIRRNDVTLSLKASGLSAEMPQTQTVPAPHKKDTPEPKAEAKTEAPKPAPAEQAKPPKTAGALTINAPLNGTFYKSAGPGKPHFVKEGDTVKADTPVCIVEAMKLFNQIKTVHDCRIIKFLVEHGQPVVKDQPLVEIEK